MDTREGREKRKRKERHREPMAWDTLIERLQTWCQHLQRDNFHCRSHCPHHYCCQDRYTKGAWEEISFKAQIACLSDSSLCDVSASSLRFDVALVCRREKCKKNIIWPQVGASLCKWSDNFINFIRLVAERLKQKFLETVWESLVWRQEGTR